MKKFLLLSFIIGAAVSTHAQEIPRRDLEDSVIGWVKMYHFKGVKEGKKIDDRFYTANQLSLSDSFANWMQASYTPKGGLGDIKKMVFGNLGLYNQHKAALPNSYGAYASTYFFLKYNSKRQLIPATNHNVTWGIMANGVPSDWAIRDISTPSQCYFTLPSFESLHEPESTKKLHDLSKIEGLKSYDYYWVRNIETGGGTDYLLLSRDNQSPFIKLTKGEFLKAMEAAIPSASALEKKKLAEAEQGNKRNIEYFGKLIDEKYEKRRAALKKITEKYAGRLNEIALTDNQPTFNDLDNDRDVFSNGYLSDTESTIGRVPVYTIDPAMVELCKKDKPQWVLVSWWWEPNDPVTKHLHESIINNFDFKFLYDFIFDPAKINRQAYKPLHSPIVKEDIIITAASVNSKKYATDGKTFFFEDFSTTPAGKKPTGWSSRLNSNGQYCTVANPRDLAGNWVELAGNEALVPLQLKKPLPQNFTISYELSVPQNFTWGAKGLSFKLAKETSPGNSESFLLLRLRPGFDGKEGEAMIETKFNSPPGYANGSKWYKAPGFSNNRTANRIKVTVKKLDETLQVFIDDAKIAEYEKAIPSALLFNAMSFTHGRSDSETEKFYLSNIRITAE